MVGYAGLSHLGLVSAAAAASRGFATIAFDPDDALVSQIRSGRLPVVEPGLPELLQDGAQRLTFTSDAAALSACDVVFIAVDVPTTAAGQSDTGPVDDLLARIPINTAADLPVVILSQVPPGFTRSRRTAFESARPSRLYCQVETLIFGRAVERALRPERFIVGLSEPAAPVPATWQRFLEAFACPILPMRYESAELAKISINLFLVSSISTTNLLAEVCERVGADWGEIAPALRLDARIGRHAYLEPGLGFGGGNLGRDLETVHQLVGRLGGDARIVQAWRANSAYRRDWALRLLHRVVLPQCRSPRLALWGLAYKQDTGSTMNSPGVALAAALEGMSVSAYDPAARLPAGLPHVEQVDTALAACAGADALVVMTPWAEFRQVPPEAIASALGGRIVIDPYRAVDAVRAELAGLRVYRLGAPEETDAAT